MSLLLRAFFSLLILTMGIPLSAQPLFEESGGVDFGICSHPQATSVSGFASSTFLKGDFKQRQILIVTLDSPKHRELLEAAQRQYSQSGTNQVGLDSFRLAGVFTSSDVIDSVYPPDSKAPYYSGDQISQKSLWRSFGWLTPDLVVILKPGDELKVGLPESASEKLRKVCRESQFPIHDLKGSHLATALTSSPETPANFGNIPAFELVCPETQFSNEGYKFLNRLAKQKIPGISSAHGERIDRHFRRPLDVAKQLDAVYGHHLSKVTYQPALSLIARLNLDDLTAGHSRYREIEQIVADYVSGEKTSLGKKPNGSVTAGHLIFSELAHRVDKQKYTPLVKKAADQIFADNGNALPVMPAHNEMSDAVFMGGPILAAAGNLTGDEHYYDLCLQHVRFMQELCLRKDGVYRHSPLDEAAWGRGNGFPALGLALVLSEIPEEHSAHQELLKDFQNHLAALCKHQDPTGMWHQVIDEPGSYREMTSTCMISFAIIRGLRKGWLRPNQFDTVLEESIPAIIDRISPEGELFDVCTGTGKQKNLQAYYDRTAILGKDERGGAMAFLCLTEYARYLKEQPSQNEDSTNP